MKRPQRLTPEQVAEKYTPEEIGAMERKVQLEGADHPDTTFLPDGRTVTEARNDIADALSLKLHGKSIYDEDEPAAEGVITGDKADESAEESPAESPAAEEPAEETAATTSRRTTRR